MKFLFLSVLLAIFLVMVIAEPLPDKDDDDNETTAEPTTEPENNAMSINQAKIWTSLASFIAFMLFR